MKALRKIIAVFFAIALIGAIPVASAFAEEVAPSVEESVVSTVEPTVEPSTGVVDGVVEKANDFINELLIFLSSAAVGLIIAALGWIRTIKVNKKLNMITAAYQQLGADKSQIEEASNQLKAVAESFNQLKTELSEAKRDLVATLKNGNGLDQQSLAEIEVLLNTGLSYLSQIKAASSNAWKNVDGVTTIYSENCDVKTCSQLAVENTYLINKIKELGKQSTEEIIADVKAHAAGLEEASK
jgi:hypothetical protein